jgi:hypothetical protein
MDRFLNEDELRPFAKFVSTRTIAIDTGGNARVNNFEIGLVTFIDGDSFAATDYQVDEMSRGWGPLPRQRPKRARLCQGILARVPYLGTDCNSGTQEHDHQTNNQSKSRGRRLRHNECQRMQVIYCR